MNLGLIFLGLIILGIIIGVSIYLWKRNSNKGFNGYNKGKTSKDYKNNTGQNGYLPTPSWGKFIPNTTPDGNCLNYTISAGTYNPGTATYADLNADGGGGYIVSLQNCLDVDQIYAQAGSHECENLNTGAAGTGCISTVTIPKPGGVYPPGSTVPVGTVEGVYSSATGGSSYPYFVPCNTGNNSTGNSGSGTSIATCPGSIGLVIPNFTPVVKYNQDTLCNGALGQNKCLAFDENLPKPGNRKYFDVVVKDCDLGDFKELFRVVRYSLTSDYQLIEDPIGKLASIIYRLNGYYLAPQMNFTPLTNAVGVITGFKYYFDQLNIDFDISSDPAQLQNTVKLQLINPADDTERIGVYWLLQDQIPNPKFEVESIAAQQYFGCNVNSIGIPQGSRNPLGASCPTTGLPSFYQPVIPAPITPPSGAYYVEAPIAPQQFLYVPDFKQVPTTNDPSDIWTYMINQFSLNTITYGGNDIPVLQQARTSIPMFVYTTDCGDFNNTYSGSLCVRKYNPFATGNPVYPINQINFSQFSDSQFISYLNFIQVITKGISPISPGCTQYATKVNGNVYNPFGSNINILTSTPGNN
jgi:hypothetical protein